MKVADVMTPRADVVTVSLPGTRDDVLEYLQERHFSAVPVVKGEGDEEVYRGLISRADLIEDPDEDQLALLLREVPTTSGDTSVVEVGRLMATEGARRVPVVDGERLTGIVTITDVVRAIADGDVAGEATCGDLARRDVNTTYAGTPLPVAEREIAYADVPYAIVLDDEADMAGVLTEPDVIDVARVVEGEDDVGASVAGDDDEWKWESLKATGNRYFPTRNVEIPGEPVSEFMTADPVTVTKRRTAREAAQRLLEHDIEQLPLVEGDALTGIVRDVDLVASL
ncbi:CBS domain-containing protein [Halarchaeum nitratireducens]|uniref:CBS domain-containing protein n=1 Tax=Halarchaeum nitratireducens TaxID=489913 RepID=A0A830G828_9EURY|nr:MULTISPECIES: CBS domain-containing protein [Halarchaeum]MBP2251998.1 CBS domain-containing protein [Halarchaeum solikamskense]GGN05535.1 CBS domain-containing protein [Halarchaeum nitratireducens]